jgi:two-component system OmpR family sensor kinase
MSDSPSASCDPRDLSHADIALFAHELRGALTVIAGYTALLRHDLDEQETAGAIEGIERAISRADALCADALAGRTPTPVHSAVREPVGVRELAEHAASDLRSATGRAIAVRFEAPDGLIVLGDGQALARMLTNVIGNAAKYSPDGTPIEVVVRAQDRPFLGTTAVVEVCDRGPGIPPEMREQAFEPFERLGHTDDTPGTGLGLAVVRNIVLAHDGRVRIQDRDGGGTVVHVELPAEVREA